MARQEIQRLIEDERGAAESEAELARDEERLKKRLDQLATDTTSARAKALEPRLSALASQPNAGFADVQKGRDLAKTATAELDVALALPERQRAIEARRTALQARDAAIQALTTQLAKAEAAKAEKERALAEAEKLVATLEKDARAAADAAQRDAARKADDERRAAEAARKAEDQRKAQASRRAAEEEAKTAPSMPAVAPAAASGGPTGTEPSLPAVAAKGVEAPKTLSANTLKKLSRRRRVKLAPPPKKLEVEVATYGDNTFYAGFEQSIKEGGVFVASLETLPEGHELDLEISLEGRKISSRGKVEFIRVDNLANPDCTQGAGIRLTNLSKDAQASIEAFFRKRPPMFFMHV